MLHGRVDVQDHGQYNITETHYVAWYSGCISLLDQLNITETHYVAWYSVGCISLLDQLNIIEAHYVVWYSQ